MSNRIEFSRLQHKACLFVSLALFISVLSFFTGPAYSDTGPLIKMIEVEGNSKISDATILSKIRSRVGDAFSKNTVQDDIKKLFGIGYFDDIRVEIDSFEGGIKLIFIFTEKQTIVSVDFQGNKEFDTKDLKEKITLTAGAVANLSLITDNIGKIISFYHSEGYWLVNVVPIIREVSPDSVDLTFQVEEGPKVVIKQITIEGNNALSVKQIKKVMKTKKRWLLSFIFGTGIYMKEQIKEDIERIKQLYHNNGYLHVSVSEPEIMLSPDKKKLSLAISISEGDQFRIADLKIKGNTVFSESEVLDAVELSSGQIFDRGQLRDDLDKVLDMYMGKGYAMADINPLVNVNNQEKTADITVSINEDSIYRIGKINISGNTKTRDKVIRREVRLDEGDIFNRKLIKRSYQRINNLDYFENVDLKPLPKPEEKVVDLDIEVEEKMTGMLSLGGGYSSVDKFMVMGEITQANLFGKGLYLKLRTDFSSSRKNYNLSVINPWFMDRPISASFRIYKEQFEFPDYDKQSTGGSIGLGKELSEYVGGNITYSLEEVTITDVLDGASFLITEQIGTKITSSISPSIWKDTRDNHLDPSSGARHSLQSTIAGLGGENYFVKGVVDSIWYFPAPMNTTFSIRGRLGYAAGFNKKTLPLYERFYVGGINTIRGLGFGDGGPRDANGERIGGNFESILNTELIFPIVKDIKLKGVIFADYGGAFDKDDNIGIDDLRYTVGFGFRWMSPFGPLRLEWGFNLNPKPDENDNKIEFSMGGFI
jgi:outer membrane protein insertion porin family